MQASAAFFLKALTKSLFHFQNDLHGQPALTLAKQPQIPGGILLRILGGGVLPASSDPDPISDQKM